MMDNAHAKELANKINLYIKGRRDTKEEDFYKDKPKKNKQGVIKNGAINTRLLTIAKKYIEKEITTPIEKSKKQKEQTGLEFQKQKYKKLLSLFPENTINEQINDLKNQLQRFLSRLEDEYHPATWLTTWTSKAVDISFATHVAKLTHSSSKGTSILDTTKKKDNSYLTTNNITNPIIDIAASNSASLPIADILNISANNRSILDYIKSGDTSFLNYITNDNSLIETWSKNLKQAYDNDFKKSYFLNKQIYFPLSASQYHLLLPLTSSSLVQEIYLEDQQYFNQENITARGQKKESLYSSTEVLSYPNKACLHVTASKHINASSLNGKRGGKINLFSTTPPQWKSKYKSVKKKSSIFDSELSHLLKNEITELKKYLSLLKMKQLNLSQPARNAAVARKLSYICDAFFNYIQLLSQAEENIGWTAESDLPIQQQLLCEPYRNDENVSSEKLKRTWIKKISEDYGRWLNNQLKNKQLNLTTVHAQLWGEHFFYELKEYIAIEEVNV